MLKKLVISLSLTLGLFVNITGNCIAEENRMFQEQLEQFQKQILIEESKQNLSTQEKKLLKNVRTYLFEYAQFDKAIDELSQLIKLKSNYVNAYKIRGFVYLFGTQQYNKAIADFNKAIELEPNCLEAYNAIGVAYLVKQEFQKALENFNKAIEINPDFLDAYNNRGWTYLLNEEYDKAIVDFTKSIQLNPFFIKAYNNRGLAYRNKGEAVKAKQNFDIANYLINLIDISKSADSFRDI